MKGKQDDVGNYWPASSERREPVTKDSEALVTNIYVMTDNISCPTHFPKDKTEHKVDSLNIYCETLCHNKVYMKNCSLSPTYSIPQNQVICTT